jgi:hypothetical protein
MSVEWALAAGSIVGAVLNANRRRVGFHVWAVANAGWCIVCAAQGRWAQVPMWVVYLLISLWGLRVWREAK